MRKEQIQKIIDRLNQVQKRATARTINPSEIEAKLEKLKRKPFFLLQANGGKVPNAYKYPAEATDIEIQYDRETNHLCCMITREKTSSCSYGANASWHMDDEIRSLCVSGETREKMKEETKTWAKADNPEYKIHVDDDLSVKYQLVVEHKGEEHHFPIREKPYTEKNLLKKIEEGRKKIEARRKQDRDRREKKAAALELINKRLVFVSLDDSLNAGNCRSETMTVKSQVDEKFDGPVGAVSHEFLLSVRNDFYAQRAVEHAAARLI